MAKINVSIPDELLRQVDELATELHESRSGFVAEATARYVASVTEERDEAERRARIGRAIERAKAFVQHGGEWDATAFIRADRDRDGSAEEPR